MGQGQGPGGSPPPAPTASPPASAGPGLPLGEARLLGAALLLGPLTGLLWVAVIGASAGHVLALAACTAVATVAALPLLLGRGVLAGEGTRPARLQALLAAYAVLLCVVAVQLGDVLGIDPFFSYLAWTVLPAFVVLTVRRALLVSAWACGCVVVVSQGYTEGDLSREIGRLGLILTVIALMATVLAIVVVRGRNSAERQRLLTEFGRRAVQHPDEASLLADVECTTARLLDHGVRRWGGPADDERVIDELDAVATPALGRLRALQAASHDALHDALTGLPNRVLAHDRLVHALERRATIVAVLLVDLDGFKDINDSYGHAAGDALLRELAPLLAARLRPGDTVARIGGDEFLVIAEDVGDLAGALAVAERLSRAWSRPFLIDGVDHHVSGSTGVAVSREDHRTASELLVEADAAMYRAKQQGPGRIEVFDAELRARAHQRLLLENDLRRAVEQDALEVAFQPILDLATGKVVSLEVLSRWSNGARGAVSPADFIPVAERLGLIRDLGERVLARAVDAAAGWHADGLRGAHDLAIGLTVNVSPLQLEDLAFPDRVARLVDQAGLPPGWLGLEVTEGMLLRNPAEMPCILGALRRAGVRLLLDDFGTGYSSLAYLHQLELDAIKIDKSFVARLATDRSARAVVAAVAGLGRDLGLDVVAEGIEDEVQLDLLRELRVRRGQGFCLGRPMPLPVASAWIARTTA